ncbi:MAG: hypothetical protein II742_04610, partial [Clostridia bacterium]|nr:hypothetical protein [Clostridia bacterium]
MDKALSISEKEKIFRKQFITTKEQLLETILKVKAKNDSNANFDFFHSSAYYSTLSSLLEEFYETTCKIVLFNNLEPFWGYSFMIDSEGITLHLSHTPSLKLDEKQEKIVSS